MTTATRPVRRFDPFAIPRFGPYGSIIGSRRYRAGLPPPPPHWRGNLTDFRRYATPNTPVPPAS